MTSAAPTPMTARIPTSWAGELGGRPAEGAAQGLGLRVGEMAHEVLRETRQVDARGGAQPGPPRGRARGERDPSVGRAALPPDQSGRLHTVDQAGEPARR